MSGKDDAPAKIGTFNRIFNFEYAHVPMALYQCQMTGLRVALARVQSPTVHGYFAVQTEAFDDYGCPHTLEHLIFLGSDQYPYKGVLDVLANRCFAQGTNAWTATDHTCYTVDTAGSEGFLQILPVYLDHVLFPTLKDSGFVTEVHHITGEGANAGVVYCEMQARENEAGDMCDRAMRLAAYPGHCSYKSETGGRLKELRELTNKTVQEYHKSYYRPENLCVIVTGQVGFTELCEACAPVVESIQKSGRIRALPPLEKPFSTPVAPLDAQAEVRIEFPAEDETNGAICELCWHGPTWDDLVSITALRVLLAYICQDSISPLRKALVETVPPLCGKISEGLHEYSTQLINVTFTSCSVEQISKRDVTAEVNAVFDVVAAPDGSGVDLERIKSLIGQQQRKHLSAVESDPHDLFSGEIIGAFMYAADFNSGSGAAAGNSLKLRLDAPGCLSSLLGWPAARWAELCRTYLKKPGVTVVGLPSKSCGEKIQETDAKRIEVQKAELGVAGCKKAAGAVAEAEDENDVDTPDDVARSFEVPDVSKVALVDVSTVTIKEGTLQSIHGKDADKLKSFLSGFNLPLPSFQFDHASGAQFVKCHCMLPLHKLTTRQLELLPLWCDVAFELPLAASSLGTAMSYEAVVQGLTDSTVQYAFSAGVGGSRFSAGQAGNMLHVSVKVEREQYSMAPYWIARILADSEFSLDRLRVAGARMLNDVPNFKRNGSGLMKLAKKALDYSDSSAHGAFSVFRAEQLLLSLKDDKMLEQVAAELKTLRSVLLEDPALVFVRIAGDVESLKGDVLAPWRQAPFIGAAGNSPRPAPALLRELFAADALQPAPGLTCGCLLSSSAEESNYWMMQCESFTDPRSPHLAPLLVAIEYVTALEGPFWRKIRGKGLSYSYSLSHSLETGKLRFALSKATNPLGAFEAACTIVSNLCSDVEIEGDENEDDDDEQEGLDPSAIEAAQSGVIFGLIEPVDTLPGAMGEAFDNMLRREPPDQLQWLLQAVQQVSEDDVRSALRTYVLPLFLGSSGRSVSMICPAQKRKEMEEGLSKMDPPFKVAHFDVDTFVASVAPADGFSSFRSKVKAATVAEVKTGTGYGK